MRDYIINGRNMFVKRNGSRRGGRISLAKRQGENFLAGGSRGEEKRIKEKSWESGGNYGK